MRSLLPPEIRARMVVVSAGTGANEGVPATALAIQTCAENGIDIVSHRSTPLTASLVRDSEWILAMEPGHAERARELAPDAKERIHLITERGAMPSGNPSPGVRDPIGGTQDQYRDTFHRIRSHLLAWVPVIRDAVERREGVR